MKKRHTIVIERLAKMTFSTRLNGTGCEFRAPSARELLELVVIGHPEILKPGRTLTVTVKGK